MDETGRVEKHRVQEFRDRVAALPEDDMNVSTWLEVMEQLQEVAYGKHYDTLDDQTRADTMMMNQLALIKEVCELGDEMGWKPWASPRGWVNREAVIDEAVDALHFLANLLKHANATPAELVRAYKAKLLKNLDRQIEGYNVLKDKCPKCKRELKVRSAGLFTCIGCGSRLHRDAEGNVERLDKARS